MRRVDEACCCYRLCTLRGFCVRMSVCAGHTGAKLAERIEMPFGPDLRGPKEPRLRPYTCGEVTSETLWPRYDRHFVGITWRNLLS